MHFIAKCNSGRIAIQWFHIKHYLDYQYIKFQLYTSWVQKMWRDFGSSTIKKYTVYLSSYIPFE